MTNLEYQMTCLKSLAEGTEMYDVNLNKFGIKHVMHGLIRTFMKPTGSEAQVTEGTLLLFEPGGIKAHVIKRYLSGKDINAIGHSCSKLDRQNATLDYVQRAIEDTETLRRTLAAGGYDNDTQINQAISHVGVIVDGLQTSMPKLKVRFHELVHILVSHRVTLVESKTKSTPDGVTPVALIAAKDLQKSSTQT